MNNPIRIGIIGVAVVAMAAGWLVGASHLFVWIGGLTAYFPHPYTTWLIYINQPNIDRWTKLYLAASGVLAAVPLALVVAICIRVIKPSKVLRRPIGGGLKPIEPGVTDNHGHAYWPSVAEMLRRYPAPAPGHGGVVIGEARRIDLEPIADVPFDSRDRSTWGLGGKAPLLIDDCQTGSGHSLVFAGSGAFKTMNAISTQFHWLGSVVTFDPSCEIGPMVRGWREKMGQRVVCLGYEAHHQGINALACIQPDKPGASSRILSMTASMCGEESARKDKNSVFDSAGRNLIACLMAHMMWNKTIPNAQKTMATLVEGITIPEDEMQGKLKEIHRSSDSQLARRLAGIAMGTHKETFSGAYFSATQLTGWANDPENATLLSGSFDPAEILNGDLSIYIQVPTATLMHVPGVARVIADSIVNSVILADGKYAERMLFQADEARLLGNMKSLEVVLLQGRKYGLAVQMLYTSVNDMRRVWSDDGVETWLDGVSWAGYAAISSMKTAEALSKAVGKLGIMAYSEGSNTGRSGQALGTNSRSRGSNTNVHEIGRNLINPEEFKDSRTDEMFVFPRSGRPFRCGLAPYFRRPEMVAEVEKTTYHRGKAA